MKNIKKFEKFSGKVRQTNLEDLDTKDVLDLANILLELKPRLSDEFPDLEMSKLIKNNVKYQSEDEIYNIDILFNESDIYLEDDDIIKGKYKTIFRVKLSKKNDKLIKVYEVKDFISLTIQLIEKSYDEVTYFIKIKKDKDIEKLSLQGFEELNDNNKLDNISFFIKII